LLKIITNTNQQYKEPKNKMQHKNTKIGTNHQMWKSCAEWCDVILWR